MTDQGEACPTCGHPCKRVTTSRTKGYEEGHFEPVCDHTDCHSQVAALVGALEGLLECGSIPSVEDVTRCYYCETEMEPDGHGPHTPECAWQAARSLLVNFPETCSNPDCHNMAAELEALRAEREEHRQHAQDKAAKVKRLRKALKPFAAYAAQVSETMPDDAPYPYHPPMVVLRAARAALAQREPE